MGSDFGIASGALNIRDIPDTLGKGINGGLWRDEHFLIHRELFSKPSPSALVLCYLSEEMTKTARAGTSLQQLVIWEPAIRLSDSRGHNASSSPYTVETTAPLWQFLCSWDSWRLHHSHKVLFLRDVAHKTSGVPGASPIGCHSCPVHIAPAYRHGSTYQTLSQSGTQVSTPGGRFGTTQEALPAIWQNNFLSICSTSLK